MGKYVFKGRFRVTGCFKQNWGYWSPPRAPHRGLDLVGDDDPTIYSPCIGIVEHAGNAGDGFGIYVKIHNAIDGRHHYFCHMERTFVHVGQKVGLGDRLGIMGHTGNVTGAHTHYEIRDNTGNIYSAAAYLEIANKQDTYNLTEPETPSYPAIVHIDAPRAGAVITSDITSTGWTISANGMVRADFYIDGKTYIGSSKALCGRRDVARAFPHGYAHSGTSGIVYRIPYATLPKGRHTLWVAGVQEKGAPVWAQIPIVVR